MDGLTNALLGLNPLLFSALLGALGAAAGIVIGRLLRRFFDVKYLNIVVIVACMVGFPKIAEALLKPARFERELDQLVESYARQPLFAAIFRVDPNARAEIRRLYVPILGLDRDTAARETERVTRQFSSRYVDRAVATASAASIAEMLGWNALITQRLAGDPKACVDYYMGRGNLAATGAIELGDAEREGEIKARLIESGYLRPVRGAKTLSRQEFVDRIIAVYKEMNLDLQLLPKLGEVNTLPPAEGCKVALAFSKAVAGTGDSETAALLFRSLMAFGRDGGRKP